MKPYVLVATLVALANARPEAGYSYPKPGGGSIGGGFGHGGGFTSVGGGHSSSGFSQSSFASNHGSSGFGGISGHGSNGFGGISSGHGGFGGVSSGHGGFGGVSSGHGGFGGVSSGHGGFGGISSGHGGFGSVSQESFGSLSHGGFNGVSNSHGHDFGSSHSGVTVQKHIYVHVPPPEPEEIHHHRPISVAPAQKHYKIIFIKAPSHSAPTAPTIPLQAQNEEKTLVYVLVKKPDEQPEITIPTAAPTQPSKPEVYFIRYKTQKEHGVSGINTGSVAGINTGSVSASGIDHHHHHGSDISSSVISGSDSGLHVTGSSSTSSVSSNYGPPGQSGPY